MGRGIMMRVIFSFIAASAAMLFPVCSLSAAGEQLEASGAYELHEYLPEDTQDILTQSGIELSEDGIGEVSPDSIFAVISQLCAEHSGQPLAACVSALGVAMLCAVSKAVSEKSDGGPTGTLDTIGAAAVSAMICVPAAGFIDSAAARISALCRFSSVLVPVLSGLAVVSGHSASAASYSAFTLTAIELINILVPSVIIPLLRILLAVAAVSTLSPSLGLDKLTGAAEKNAKWLMGLTGVLMSGALGISSVAAAAADRTSVKAARFVISGAVPVVGGAISDALGTITNCISIVRTSAGAFGMIAALFILLPTVVSAVIWMMGLSCASWMCEALGAARPAAVMRSVGAVVSLTLGLLVLSAVLTICSAALIMNLRSA